MPNIETPDERAKRWADETEQYELEHDIVPGTSRHKGDGPNGGPGGGTSWEGKARSALARQVAGLPLDVVDREALARHPHPRSSFSDTCTRCGATCTGEEVAA